MTGCYSYAGEVVDSPIDLDLAPHPGTAGCTLTLEHVPELSAPPALARVVMSGLIDGHRATLGAVTSPTRWWFTNAPGCSGTIELDGRSMHIEAREDAPLDWLREVITNWALTYRRVTTGGWAFHGSAVQTATGPSIAVLGSSGSGKTTLAAAMCAAGGRLVADDVLAGEVNERHVSLGVTSTSIKLRSAARPLEVRLHAALTSDTFDGRRRVCLPPPEQPVAPLRALYFLDRSEGPPEARLLRPAEVTARLVSNSKLVTWIDPAYRAAEFEAACDIADRVPGYALRPVDFGQHGLDALIDFAGELLDR